MRGKATRHHRFVLLALGASLAACGGGSSRPPPVQPAFNIGVLGADGLRYGDRNPGQCAEGIDCAGNLAGIGGAPTRAKAFQFKQTVAAWNNVVLDRRYLLYVPPDLPTDRPLPLVWVFHGANVEAETTAWFDTYNGFEDLADSEKFILVYGNAISTGAKDGWRYPGFWRRCQGDVDIQYVRQVTAALATEHGLNIDAKRIYATGPSDGGAMTYALVFQAADLIAAAAPAIAGPFNPGNAAAELGCEPGAGHDKIPLLVMAGTGDPLIAYAPDTGKASDTQEGNRDAWLAALGISGDPARTTLPDPIANDSMVRSSSYIELEQYPAGAEGQTLWFYRIVGGQHGLPHPVQLSQSNWNVLGKRNQDARWADLAWAFFKNRAKP